MAGKVGCGGKKGRSGRPTKTESIKKHEVVLRAWRRIEHRLRDAQNKDRDADTLAIAMVTKDMINKSKVEANILSQEARQSITKYANLLIDRGIHTN